LDKGNEVLARPENGKKNCGRVDNPIRNKFPYWNFSKFEAEFELKFREPN
jgi:hypothetical protein